MTRLHHCPKTLTKTKLTCIIVDEKRRDENVLHKIKTKIKSLFIFVYNRLCFFISCYGFKIFRTSSRLRAVAQVTGLILLLNTQHTKRTRVTSDDDMLGRRKRLDIWSHFKYNDTDKKSECVIITDGKHCGQRISGKNTTNLKRHLKANHPHIQVS